MYEKGKFTPGVLGASLQVSLLEQVCVRKTLASFLSLPKGPVLNRPQVGLGCKGAQSPRESGLQAPSAGPNLPHSALWM